MARESKTKTIRELLLSIGEEDKALRTEIEKTFDACQRQICNEKVKWREFKVYLPSIPLMENILKAKAAEYIMAVSDKIDSQIKVVKISLKKDKETAIWTVRTNGAELFVSISISNKRLRELKEKIDD